MEKKYNALALVKVKGGFGVLYLTLEGKTVVDVEVLTDGAVPRHHAEDEYRLSASTRILFPHLGSENE